MPARIDCDPLLERRSLELAFFVILQTPSRPEYGIRRLNTRKPRLLDLVFMQVINFVLSCFNTAFYRLQTIGNGHDCTISNIVWST